MVAVNEPDDAEAIVARVAPKKTMLLAAVVLKLVPLMVTEFPGIPIIELTDVIVGMPKTVIVLESVFTQPLASVPVTV